MDGAHHLTYWHDHCVLRYQPGKDVVSVGRVSSV